MTGANDQRHEEALDIIEEDGVELRKLKAEIKRLERENRELRAFVRDRVADRSVMLTHQSGYHARRICLEAEKILKESDQ